jgi:ceramide glucosyltransferase
MTTLEIVLGSTVAIGVLLAMAMCFSQRALLRASPPPEPSELPPISILKPLKGVDADLQENLRTFFKLDYPSYEIILGAEDPDDPVLLVARGVAEENPHVRSAVISDKSAVGLNPKVNNLANLIRRARHPLILISDSNIRVRPGYLRDLVAHRARSKAALVWSLFRGMETRGLGAILESFQLNTFVMGGVCGITKILKLPCAVGKSMLLHREDLRLIGGFEFLSKFLAEDQICAEELAVRGRPVAVSSYVIDNVLGRRTLGEFMSRHLRWARLRRHVNLAGYLGEALLNPVFLAILWAIIVRRPLVWAGAGGILALTSLLDAGAERAAGVRRSLLLYPVLELLLSIARGLLWFVPLFSRTLVWRSNVIRIGPRSRIELKRAAVVAATEPQPIFGTRGRHAAA